MSGYSRWLNFIPVMIVMGIIFFTSHLPGNSFNLPDVPGIDKLIHSLIYCVLGVTAFMAISPETRQRQIKMTGFLIIFFCLLYGISDEYHQAFVPGRFPSKWDLLADVLGGITAVIVWYRLIEPYLQRRRP